MTLKIKQSLDEFCFSIFPFISMDSNSMSFCDLESDQNAPISGLVKRANRVAAVSSGRVCNLSYRNSW